MAIDRSEDGARVIVLVGAREYILKRENFLNSVSWLEHFREIHPRRKRSYLAKLPKRFLKVSKYLLYVKVFTDINELLRFVKRINPAVVLVDDKLLHLFREVNALMVPEKNIRYKHHRKLMLLADSLANYFRRILKENPRRFKEELGRFEK